MKDLHTHILPGIDDGAKSLEESIDILKKAFQNGVTDIVLTPHYIKDSIYSTNNKEKIKLMNQLKQEIKKQNLKLNLFLGNEIYIDEDITSLMETEASTINNSKYILMELPLNTKYLLLDEVLFQLKQKKLIPIIAHPERYSAYYKDFDFFARLQKNGCLFQGNIGSLYGYYGQKSKKMLKKMLKKNMIHFLASDIHHQNNIYQNNIQKDLLKIVKNDKIVTDLLETNVEKVLKNKNI